MSAAEQNQDKLLAGFWERYGAVRVGPRPKHVVLRTAFNAAISDGHWPPGARLPTETELVDCTGYSLGTVQRAMRALAEQGVVERRRRKGTYVACRRRQLESPWHCRFLGDDGETFLPVFTTVVGRTVTDREGPWSNALGQGDENIVRIDRHMEINSEFTVYSEFYVREQQFPQFMEMPAETLSGADLKSLIIATVGAPLTAIREKLRISRFPRYVCSEIDVPDGTAGIHVQATAEARNALPVYYQELFVPPTERRLYVESRMPLS